MYNRVGPVARGAHHSADPTATRYINTHPARGPLPRSPPTPAPFWFFAVGDVLAMIAVGGSVQLLPASPSFSFCRCRWPACDFTVLQCILFLNRELDSHKARSIMGGSAGGGASSSLNTGTGLLDLDVVAGVGGGAHFGGRSSSSSSAGGHHYGDVDSFNGGGGGGLTECVRGFADRSTRTQRTQRTHTHATPWERTNN